MRWTLALVVLAGSAVFLVRRYAAMTAPPPPPAPASSLPGAAAPPPLLGAEDLRKVKAYASQGEPEVRWAALQLLCILRDPEASGLIDKWMADCGDAGLRLKAVELLKTQGSLASLQSLRTGLRDPDKDVRLASLKALGDAGDPASIAWISRATRDPEPEVKAEALRTLGRFQERRTAEYAALADRLRREYEDAVKKARENAN